MTLRCESCGKLFQDKNMIFTTAFNWCNDCWKKAEEEWDIENNRGYT